MSCWFIFSYTSVWKIDWDELSIDNIKEDMISGWGTKVVIKSGEGEGLR